MTTTDATITDILGPVQACLLRLYGALTTARLFEVLVETCRDFAASEHVSLLTFQRHGRRARVRFSNHPRLCLFTDHLLPFDAGPLSAALRSGAALDVTDDDAPAWDAFGDGRPVCARSIRPLVFDNEVYGALLFHDVVEVTDQARLWLDLIGEAAGLALMKCEIDEERARQVVDNRVRLAAITRMGRALNGLDLEVLLQRMMDVALSAVNGQVGSIVLARGDRLETAVEWGLDHAVAESLMYASGVPVMQEVYDTKLPILIADAQASSKVQANRDDVSVESYVCIPLHTERGALGVLNVVNSTSGRAFGDRDMDLLLTICNLASAALENALLHEEAVAKERMDTQLDIASGIQKSLLPEVAPSVPGLDIAGWNHPCEMVGGDYFDFVQLDDGRTAVVVGDVSGHGIGPAFLMSSARAALRSLITCEIGPEQIMEHLNRLLTNQVLPVGTFITMIFAVLEPDSRELVFTNAGHPPPIVFSAANLSIREPEERGMVLGVDADMAYPESNPIQLAAGDLVAFYTDGILDATNEDGEWFGKERLTKAIMANRELPARNMIDAVRAEMSVFCGKKPPPDDLTLVLVKAL